MLLLLSLAFDAIVWSLFRGKTWLILLPADTLPAWRGIGRVILSQSFTRRLLASWPLSKRSIDEMLKYFYEYCWCLPVMSSTHIPNTCVILRRLPVNAQLTT